MTKTEALYAFWSGFGLTAYPTVAEPDTAFPYLVYEPTVGTIDDGEIQIAVNLWYYGGGETAINAKVQEISSKISAGVYIECDGGAILIQRGTPFAQAQTDQADDNIKGRYLNILVTYLTED